ncbi:hypothetical protein [Micrococcoides hystricis]|uniref:Uncharacterized protein n=1 Tax=Micrococcoides hystricis TaxID=1572761 RepID=A0ABV6PBR7_9MICC
MDVHRIAAHARTHVPAHSTATTAVAAHGAVEPNTTGGRSASDAAQACSEATEQSALEGPSSQPGQTGRTRYSHQLPKAVRLAWNGCC